jgi:hypothetical protein
VTTSLVILAAGLGSRYGGAKQHQAVGPSGETLPDYAAFDALRSGLERLVFVTRSELLLELEERNRALRDRVEVRYVIQRPGDRLLGHQPPAGRTKPWGTAHALLCAAEHLDGPFGVLNGDDFYGHEALALLAEHAQRGDDTFAVLGYRLSDTLSEHGGVTRAMCDQDENGFLRGLTELTGIVATHGGIRGRGLSGASVSLTGDETISRNCWGFTPRLFEPLAREFGAFLERDGASVSAEFLLPEAVHALVIDGQARVRVLPVREPGFGLTHSADLPVVRDAIRRLVAAGVYPSPLWS